MQATIAELVEQARGKRGETAVRQAAFAALVNRYQGMVYRVALSILGDADLAQDVVQEAFVAAYRQLGQLREPAAFGGWLRQIAQTHAYRLVRRQQPPTTTLEDELIQGHSSLDPAVALETIEMKQRVMDAVMALPENEQVVTRMFYVNGYSQKEIAGLLELPLTTVKKRLQYARQHLRGILTAMWVTAPEPTPVLIPVPVRREAEPPQRGRE